MKTIFLVLEISTNNDGSKKRRALSFSEKYKAINFITEYVNHKYDEKYICKLNDNEKYKNNNLYKRIITETSTIEYYIEEIDYIDE